MVSVGRDVCGDKPDAFTNRQQELSGSLHIVTIAGGNKAPKGLLRVKRYWFLKITAICVYIAI